ncbi:MAG: diadenylate cyclase CdaA [Roseibacillus sp.]|nr:diadenylate cyclase CdaA [Roseibacillus sp.]MDP7106328.1 diadenylate cyclase CdaA [Roseibacillus sp.]HJM63718.1 diadenylate cyclase CdaA [Roseibacillus sp.]
MEVVLEFLQEHWRSAVEILILWVFIYQLYRTFRATRGARILVGLAMIFVVLTLASQLLQLEVMQFIITRVAVVAALALLIIFQPELRMALARLGSSRLWSFNITQQEEFLSSVADAVWELSKKRYGALFAIERSIGLKDQIETGVEINGDLSSELALTIFHPKTALHDGGVVLSGERIVAASCVFSVSQTEIGDRSMGLRHRAAIGLTEESDAVTIVVSEETGAVSICVDGRIERNMDEDGFRDRLEEIFLSDREGDSDEQEATEEVVPEQLDTQDSVAPGSDRSLVSD